MNAIEIDNLSKYYGDVKGIESLTIAVQPGEIVGFVGKNGAGKSTTIRTLLNFIYPTGGSAKIFGLDCVKDSKKIKEITAYLPEEVNYYEDMKVKDLLSYSEAFLPEKDEKYKVELLKYFELDGERNIGDLSLGNRKKVGIIICLLKKAKLIILDEPTSGLDPLMQKKFFNKLLAEKKKGVTIFLSSHNLTDVEQYCDRVVIIRGGKLVKTLTLANVKKERKMKVMYTEKGKKKPESFILEEDINVLIRDLSSKNLESLEIRYQNIEEEFEKYYKGDNDDEK